MRTLAFLPALVLLTLQNQAEPLPETAEAFPISRQEHPGKEDKEIAIFLEGDQSSALQDAGVWSGLVCTCRRRSCGFLERIYGACRYRGVTYRLCCR